MGGLFLVGLQTAIKEMLRLMEDYRMEFCRIILRAFQDSFVNRVSANPEPMIDVISQQRERTVMFRDPGRPKRPDLFELQ